MSSNASRWLTYLPVVLYAIRNLPFLFTRAVGIPLVFIFRKLGTGTPT